MTHGSYRGNAVIHSPAGSVVVQARLWRVADAADEPEGASRGWRGAVLLPWDFDVWPRPGELVSIEVEGVRGDALVTGTGSPAELAGTGPAPF